MQVVFQFVQVIIEFPYWNCHLPESRVGKNLIWASKNSIVVFGLMLVEFRQVTLDLGLTWLNLGR